MDAVNLYLADVSLNLGLQNKGCATLFTQNDIVHRLKGCVWFLQQLHLNCAIS